jgi:hypothetical protein
VVLAWQSLKIECTEKCRGKVRLEEKRDMDENAMSDAKRMMCAEV